MWWCFEKLSETINSMLYAYGYESKETTGQFEYDKINKKIKILKYAVNHSDTVDIQYPVYQLINHYPNLDKKIIAYG